MKTLLITTASLLLSFSIFAKEKNTLHVTYTKTDVSCAGQNNGNITLSVSGGTEPYQINWKNGDNSLELKNLHGGTYYVEVKDAKGKTVKQVITIEEPSPLGFYYKANDLTRVDEFNGLMDISIFGGSAWEVEDTKDYFVRLNGKSYYENPEKIEDGLYTLSIEDAKGCTFSLKVNVNVEVVKSSEEAKSTVSDHSYILNSFGTINLYVIQHDLVNSSILQNYNNQSSFEYSIR